MDINESRQSMELDGSEICTNACKSMDDGACTDSILYNHPEDRSEANYSHKVENVSTITETYLSPAFYVRNLPWKLMFIPSSDPLSERSFGFFLQCNAESDSKTWSCYGYAELKIKSVDPEKGELVVRKIKHLFNRNESDWGFSKCATWQQLRDILINDSLILEVYVIAEAPHGVLWDSKKYTGFVGLKNQGATCYMNSLLQTLYFTNLFRKAVYKMPTECDDANKSVALALQRVFYELQFSDKPVGTKNLTNSFGWDTLDSFMQHDVQEFLRVLLDKLEDKMKGTNLEGIIPKLFEGKMMSYIKCKNIDISSKKLESYYDIQLNIKGNKNIYDSFKDYVATEILEGDNKYDAGEHGLQDAEKGVLFVSFPPVLHLHLMRFQYDPVTDNSIKFNDRFEFYEQIDLSPFLAEGEPKNAVYKLHAVLVHSGDNHGGHYVVYINPRTDGRWCKFDDDVVCSCTKFDAIDRNYGGTDEDLCPNDKQNSNAYMLVYIKYPEISQVLQPIDKDDIPLELSQRLEDEKRVDVVKRMEKNESDMFVTVQVLLEEYFEENQGLGLFDQEKVQCRQFKFKKSQSITEVMDVFAESFKISPPRLRIWTLLQQLQVLRLIYFDFNDEKNMPVSHFVDSQGYWTIFLETADIGTYRSLPPFDRKQEIIVFFKLFEPKMMNITYLFHSQLSVNTKLSELVSVVCQHLGIPDNTEFIIYEEKNCSSLRKLANLNESLDKVLRIIPKVSGYILVFEQKYREDLNLPTCEDFLLDLVYKVDVLFVDKNVPNDPGFTLELSQQFSYQQVALAVARKINAEPNKIQFYKCQSYKDIPGSVLKYSSEHSLKDMIPFTKTKSCKKLYYEKLSIDVRELESKMRFKCNLVSINMKDQEDLILYVNKSDTIADILTEASKVYKFSENGTGQLRFIEVINHRIFSRRNVNTTLEELLNNICEGFIMNESKIRTFRVEEIPVDELNLEDDEMLVPVSHFNKEVYQSFGDPFLIKVKVGENYSDLKARIQSKLKVSQREWEKYKLVFVAKSKAEYVTDDAEINLLDFKHVSAAIPVPYLALEHIDKSEKKLQRGSQEKSIKIYN